MSIRSASNSNLVNIQRLEHGLCVLRHIGFRSNDHHHHHQKARLLSCLPLPWPTASQWPPQLFHSSLNAPRRINQGISRLVNPISSTRYAAPPVEPSIRPPPPRLLLLAIATNIGDAIAIGSFYLFRRLLVGPGVEAQEQEQVASQTGHSSYGGHFGSCTGSLRYG